MAIAVDCFSKWVEIKPLPSKHSFRVAEWFYNDVLARWGKPKFVRSDNGTEWGSVFALLLQDWGIKHHHITVGNSKANGLVERAIRTIKQIIRKGLSLEP